MVETKGSTQSCDACSERARDSLGFGFSMAFQPIIDIRTQTIFAHEALVRGSDGSSAQSILSQVTSDNRYAFDQACRVKAIELARRLDMNERVSINFLPNAVYNPVNCIRATLSAARRYSFPVDRIIFEITEGEQVTDIPHLNAIIREYKSQGFLTAIDDFGAGWSGLTLLSELQPNIIKIDMALVREIDRNMVRQSIVRATLQVCRDLGITVVAEGIESRAELDTLSTMGVNLFQGYFFARPVFEAITPRAEILFPPEPANRPGDPQD